MPVTLPRLPHRRAALLAAALAWLASAPLLAQQVALPDTRDNNEFGTGTALRATGRPRWQGRMQVTLQIVPTCQLSVDAAASPSIRCTRGVVYRASLLSDASPVSWATPATVLAPSSRDADASGPVRITEKRLLVEF